MAAHPHRKRDALLHDLTVLVRCRFRQMANALDQQLRDTPVRTFIVLLLLALIWIALYLLLDTIFHQVGRWELVAVVANRQIFLHFFMVLAIMLAFSSAVLAFGSLFGREEAAHLLSMPLWPRQVLTVKWIEGMLLSSWSFLLLGVPLMLAVARNTTVEWYYYPLFIGHFIGFVLIPSTLGLLIAWAIAMWVPRRPLLLLLWLGVILACFIGYNLWRLSQELVETEQWVEFLFKEFSITQSTYLPSTWTAEGVVAAMDRRVFDSVVYFFVVIGNACFLAWLVINLLGRNWPEAYSRARLGQARAGIRRGWVTEVVCTVLFFYLPTRLRLVLLKDLRGFARDATQWTQMAIMLGLLVIYALNLKRLPLDLDRYDMKMLIAFLNLVTISLILATFTSRFVYPLLSLESQQLWLLGLLPIHRATLLFVKFLFALTITSLSGVGVMWLAVTMLDLPPVWARLNLLLCFAICIGLSGLSVGLGARFPVLGQRNPARIASGLGGTVNLIASMLFVAIVVSGVAIRGSIELQRASQSTTEVMSLSATTWDVSIGLLIFSVMTATAALAIGSRHFARLEV